MALYHYYRHRHRHRNSFMQNILSPVLSESDFRSICTFSRYTFAIATSIKLQKIILKDRNS